MTYLPPLPKQQVVAKGAYDATRGQLQKVATYQRWVLIALLVNVGFAALVIASGSELISIPPSFSRAIGIARFPVCILMTVCAVLLAKQFWHIAVAILCGLAMWVPYVSLLVLIVLNQKATRFLQQWGVKVGLLGANPGRI